jgi:acyl-CoA reductase-like NAD-dependent aldehyde dehydrogenase
MSRMERKILQQEVFGPVLTVQKFRHEAQTTRLAQQHGIWTLRSSFTTDEKKGNRVAETLVAGTIWINCFFVRDLVAPFGGPDTHGWEERADTGVLTSSVV